MEQLGKILIVDDNEDVLFALNLLLEPYAEKIKVAVTPDRIEHFMTTFRPENFMLQASASRQKKEEEVLNLEQLERQAVERAMRLSEGNVTRAAEYLGITRFALYRKLEKLGL